MATTWQHQDPAKSTAMPPIDLTLANEVLKHGLQLVGYTEKQVERVKQGTNEHCFWAHFGSLPLVYTVLWTDLQICTDPLPSVGSVDFDKVLMTIYFIKTYPTEETLALRFHLHKQTVLRENCCAFRNKDCLGTRLGQLKIHCVNFGVNEPRHPALHKRKEYFDQKGGKAGQTYEIDFDLWQDRIVWLNGPFPPNDGGDRAMGLSSLLLPRNIFSLL